MKRSIFLSSMHDTSLSACPVIAGESRGKKPNRKIFSLVMAVVLTAEIGAASTGTAGVPGLLGVGEGTFNFTLYDSSGAPIDDPSPSEEEGDWTFDFNSGNGSIINKESYVYGVRWTAESVTFTDNEDGTYSGAMLWKWKLFEVPVQIVWDIGESYVTTLDSDGDNIPGIMIDKENLAGLAGLSIVFDGPLTGQAVPPPVVTFPESQTNNEGEDVKLQILASDLNGDVLNYSASGLPTGLSIDADTGLISGTISFDAVVHPGISKDFSTSIVVSDSRLDSTVNFEWTVDDVNRSPVASDDTASTTAKKAVTVDVLANDSEPDGDVLSNNGLAKGPSNGTVDVRPDGTVTYTPAPDFFGNDSFDYEVVDGYGGNASATVLIVVDNDTDSDGIADSLDNCPDVANPIQVCTLASDCLGSTNSCVTGYCTEQNDNDDDALGDVCDPDDDNDGVVDLVDNCPIAPNSRQEDADYDGLGDACDGTFTSNTVANEVAEVSSDAAEIIQSINVPGGNGLMNKLTGEGGVVTKVDNAISAYESEMIDLATYLSELYAASDKLDAFDNQLSGKINSGKIVEPESSELTEASNNIRALINDLIENAGRM